MRKRILFIGGLGFLLLILVIRFAGYLPFIGIPRNVEGNSSALFFRWAHRNLAKIRSQPILEKDLILVRTGEELIAVNAITGKEVWKYGAGSITIPDNMILVQDNLVLVRGNLNSALDALNLQDGTFQWRLPNAPLDGMIGTATIDSGRVYVSRGRSGYVWAYSLDAGRLIWQSPQLESSFVSMVSRPDGLYLFNTLDLIVLDSETGRVKKYLKNRFEGRQPILLGDLVIQQFQKMLIARELESGKVRWSYPRNTQGAIGYIGVVNGKVYASDSCCEIIALNLADGNLLWRKQFDSSIDSTVVAIQDLGYVLLQNGSIHAFDLETGGNAGTILTAPPISSGYYLDKGLVTDANYLYATFGDNSLFAFGTK
jgi:outer membrane protein assembly factor BamB